MEKSSVDDYVYDPKQPYNAFNVPQWNSYKIHPNTGNWRKCLQQEVPGFPKVSSGFYDGKERPVIVYTWNTLKNFIYPHEVSIDVVICDRI
jgi:hypothetical protein